MGDINTGRTVDTVSEFGDDSAGERSRWITEIELAQKELDNWYKRAAEIERRYRDERNNGSFPWQADSVVKYNVLWSNIQTLQPAVYSRVPKPQVERRFRDNDPVARLLSISLERCLQYSLQSYDFDALARLVRDDFLLVGRGQAWVRYVPYYADYAPASVNPLPGTSAAVPADNTGSGSGAPITNDVQAPPEQEVVYEEVVCDYIHWSDYLHNPARVEAEVRWRARRAFMSRDELIRRFGEEKGSKCNLDYMPGNIDDKTREGDLRKQEVFRKAVVWEIWDKPSRTVYWVCTGYTEGLLDKIKDPLRLRDFFPCPRPIVANYTTSTLTPIPDFILYQDQAKELDDLTDRIAALTKALRVAGVYDGSCDEIKRLYTEGADNQLIPVMNWSYIAEKGGLRGVIDYVPFEAIMNVLLNLYQAREKVKQDLYEITGMSDIVRGSSNPYDTATAQQIKGQFATLRIADKQAEMQRFLRDIIAIKGEIIAEHFSDKTIFLMSGIDAGDPGDLPYFPQMIEMMRNDMMRRFRIDIETDSTLAIDETMEKEKRIEFLNSMGQFLNMGLAVFQQAPALSPVVKEMITFGARGFRAGKTLEAVLNQSFDALIQQQQQAAQQPPPPDPEMMKVEAEREQMQFKLQLEQQKMQNEITKLELDAKRLDNDVMLRAQEQNTRMQMEIDRISKELELKAIEIQNAQQIETLKVLSSERVEQTKATNDSARAERESVRAATTTPAAPAPQSAPPISVVVNMPPSGKKFVFKNGPKGTRIAEEVASDSAEDHDEGESKTGEDD